MRCLRTIVLFAGLGLLPALVAQPTPPKKPSAGDIREEQRLIDNAYLGDAEFQIKLSRERLGNAQHKLSQQSGLWALEQIGYAKLRIERHAPKIEEAVGLFGRISEDSRKELRESYKKVREHYAITEERLESIAAALDKAGFPILARTLENVRNASGDGIKKAISDGLAAANVSGKGDANGGETLPPSTGGTGGGSGGGSSGGGQTISVGKPPQSVRVDSNGVTVGSTAIPGIYNPANQTVTSPQFGVVDLKTSQTNSNGVTFIQSDRGVVVIPPGILIAGATLNPDGTIRFKDGTVASINDLSVGGDGKISVRTPGKSPYQVDPASGMPSGAGGLPGGGNGMPPGTIVGANGQPITVDGDAPPFQNGKREFIRKTYIGARDTILQREVKVSQKLLEATGSTWKVDEQLGESRSWTLKIDLKDTQSGSGKLTGTIVVGDAGGTTGISVANFEIQDDSGQKPSVQKGAAPGTYTATFTKSGDYTAMAEGSTDWGSRFRLEATFPVGVR